VPFEYQHRLIPMDREQFGKVSFDVLRDIFLIHNSLGRFFDESVYKSVLAELRTDTVLESWIDVSFDTFRKRYLMDAVVQDGAIFELKSVEMLTSAHEAQLLHYLMLCDLRHGMLINVRNGSVEHRFVNNATTLMERRSFETTYSNWNDAVAEFEQFKNHVVSMVNDFGTGLERSLYEEALIHFYGGIDQVEKRLQVFWKSKPVGNQRFRLIAPKLAFKITTMEDQSQKSRFVDHTRKMLKHVPLEAISWVNIARHEVSFRILEA